MGSKPKAPAPINVGAATQQIRTENDKTLGQQQAYNRPDQQNQFGSTLQWRQTGTDANGNPTFEQTQSLGGTGQQFASGFSGLGQQYIDQAQAGPGDSTGAFNQANALWHSINDPNIQRQSDQLDTKLKNQGFTADSEGYKNATQDLKDQQARDAQQFQLSAQNQMFNQGLQGWQSGLNALSPGVNYGNQAITGGFQNSQPLNVQGVDVASLINANQQQQNQNYQSALQSYNGMLGGIAGLGGTVLGSALGGPIGGQIGRQLAGGGGGGSSSPPLPWLTSWQG